MARKTVHVLMATFSRVCIPVMFVMESHQTKQKLFSWLRRRPTLVKKIEHFSGSIFMLNSEPMVLLHLQHKILCS